jgi:hypothetical protein
MPLSRLGSPCSTSDIAWLATLVLCHSEADRVLPTRIAVRATRDDLPASRGELPVTRGESPATRGAFAPTRDFVSAISNLFAFSSQ